MDKMIKKQCYRRTITVKRQFMLRFCSRWLELVTVNEYPKSGGTWMGQLLATTLGLRFPRNRMPPFAPCVMHGHYLHSLGLYRPLIIWRDGRDVLVSYYYHCYFPNGIGNEALVAEMRRLHPFRDYDDVRANLPAFVELMLTTPPHPHFTWPSFVAHWWHNGDAVHVRYEDLLTDAMSELRRVVRELGREVPPDTKLADVVEQFAFKRQSGRSGGDDRKRSFLRKGIAGDWKNQFTRETCEVFDHYAGDALIELGYEPDHAWVNKSS